MTVFLTMSQALINLKGVGAKFVEKLAKLQILDQHDLLLHLPMRYQDRTQLLPINLLKAHTSVMIQGEVVSSRVMFGRKRSLLVRLKDSTGSVGLRFYYFNVHQQKQLTDGNLIRAYGEVRPGQSGYELYHPEYQQLKQADSPLDNSLTPIYHLADGISQNKLRNIIQQALTQRHVLEELIPQAFLHSLNLPSLQQAVHLLHQPSSEDNIQQILLGEHPAQKRLCLEELLAHHLSLQKNRQRQKAQPAMAFPLIGALQQQLMTLLPFNLTSAQQRVSQEISCDLAQPHPMLRLVQGDVGSGKTLVAALAALQVIEHQQQVALMAPTEILAEQHFTTLSQWFSALNIEVAWLVGKQTKKQRQQALDRIASGQARMVVGTHALFQQQVQFFNLNLAIIDEQHRFGVDQRLALKNKGNGLIPHQLTLTATPIPRTLAMSAYADLDCSNIDELPPGRKPIQTHLISQQRRQQVIERVQHAVSEGRQVYWVNTLIDENEELELEAAKATYETLCSQLLNCKVGLVHGQLKANEKSKVMQQFKSGELDLLVATTVIEVGVDVPNASIMIIENPERLGLAQLHQLRGRVGRGDQASFCLLMYAEPLSKVAQQRLSVMRQSQDGFYIAEQDLALRGPGEVLGTRQTGAMQFKIADLVRDKALLPIVEQLAQAINQQTPMYIEPLITRWLKQSIRFAQV